MADGVLLSVLSGPADTCRARDEVAAGAEKAGRPPLKALLAAGADSLRLRLFPADQLERVAAVVPNRLAAGA